MNEELTAFLKDEALAKELFEQENPEDAQQFLAAYDVDATIDEIKKLFALTDGENSSSIK